MPPHRDDLRAKLHALAARSGKKWINISGGNRYNENGQKKKSVGSELNLKIHPGYDVIKDPVLIILD